MALLPYTSTTLRNFINRAEDLWFIVFDSSLNGRLLTIGGNQYRQLPTRFNTRTKIFAFFRRYFGPSLSRILLCNLRTLRYRGALYVPVGDPGPVPTRVVSLAVIRRTSSRIAVRAVLSGDPDGNVTILYTFAVIRGRLAIINRTRRLVDYRYQPCR
ncbi:DL-endopeptidase inhibitor IseA family protein [Paenibacillus sp. S-38]|uniref:DL-endopeptidase inhibitor IseA family protein n=1 Tax=Paenibacillus sp. S-38 TaxID=3416710 RepID=UPI003CEA676E